MTGVDDGEEITARQRAWELRPWPAWARPGSGLPLPAGRHDERPTPAQRRRVTVDIGEFVAARLAEEERDARAAQGQTTWSGPWVLADDPEPGRVRLLASSVPQSNDPPILRIPNLSLSIGAHIARQDPAATLARVAALRALVGEHGVRKPYPKTSPDYAECTRCHVASEYGDGEDWPCDVVMGVAAIWAAHPDYRAEWKP